MDKTMAGQNMKSSVGFSPLKGGSRGNFFEKSDNILAIYTASCVLKRISDRYGSQGMTAYLNSYIRDVGEREPKLRAAVDCAVSMLNIERMYQEAVSN